VSNHDADNAREGVAHSRCPERGAGEPLFDPVPAIEAETRVLIVACKWLVEHPDLIIPDPDLMHLAGRVERENLSRTQIAELLPGLAVRTPKNRQPKASAETPAKATKKSGKK